jgi:hypothetical protein
MARVCADETPKDGHSDAPAAPRVLRRPRSAGASVRFSRTLTQGGTSAAGKSPSPSGTNAVTAGPSLQLSAASTGDIASDSGTSEVGSGRGGGAVAVASPPRSTPAATARSTASAARSSRSGGVGSGRTAGGGGGSGGGGSNSTGAGGDGKPPRPGDKMTKAERLRLLVEARQREADAARQRERDEAAASRQGLLDARGLPPLNNRVVPCTPAGELFVWGTSVFGALGIGHEASTWIPRPVLWGEQGALVRAPSLPVPSLPLPLSAGGVACCPSPACAVVTAQCCTQHMYACWRHVCRAPVSHALNWKQWASCLRLTALCCRSSSVSLCPSDRKAHA